MQATLHAWSTDRTLAHVLVASSVPLLYMGTVPSWLLFTAEKERTVDRYDLGNDTRALLDLLPADRTTVVAGDIHMYLRTQLCNAATGACLTQVERARPWHSPVRTAMG